MATFIDFVSNEMNNKTIVEEFISLLENNNPMKLVDWFKSRGYEISTKEWEKMFKNKDGLLKHFSGDRIIDKQY